MSHFIEIDSKKLDLAKLLLSEIPNGVNRAVNNAINRSLGNARDLIYKQIKNDYNLVKTTSRKKEIMDTVPSTVKSLGAFIYFRGPNLPLSNFKITPSRQLKKQQQTMAEVRRTGMKPLKHAFVRQMESGHIGVFERVGQGRYPIKQLYAASFPQMMNQALARNSDIKNLIQQKVEYELDGQVDRLLKGINV